MKRVKSLPLLILTSVLLSCTAEPRTEPSDDVCKSILLSRQEYISIAFDGETELEKDEVMQIFKDFIKQDQSNPATRGIDVCDFSKCTKFYINSESDKHRFAVKFNSENNESLSFQELIPVYEVEYTSDKGKGLAIISGDRRVSEVIAYLPDFGDHTDEIPIQIKMALAEAQLCLYSKVQEIESIRQNIRSQTINKISKELGHDASEFSYSAIRDRIRIVDDIETRNSPIPNPPNTNVIESVNPICVTAWDTFSPYNGKLPQGNLGASVGGGYGNTPAGTSTTAIAQIFAIAKPNILMNGKTIDWNYLTQNEMISDPYPPYYDGDPLRKRQMVQDVYKFIYDGTKATLGYDNQKKIIEPVISDANIASFMKQYFTFSESSTLNFANIRNSLKGGLPVYLKTEFEYYANNSLSKKELRSYLIDGFIYRTATSADPNSHYFHFEFGLGSWANGWYLGGYTATYKPMIIITIPNTDVDYAMVRSGMGRTKAYYNLNLK